MSKIRLNGINIHYQQKGSGPDVVLIHGITSCLAQWYVEIMPALARDYRVTTYDLRGHGLTEITETGYTSEEMAGDLLALMDHLDIQKPVLVGHSFGGSIGLNLALTHPERVRGVVALDTGLACLRYLRVIHDWPGWEMYGSQLSQFGITLERFLEVDRNQDVTDFIKQSLTIPLQAGFRKGQSPLSPRLLKLLDGTKMGYEFREIGRLTEEALMEIDTPVLALYGGISPYEKMAERLSQRLPRCHYELLENSGHFYAIEEPELVISRISGFLQDPDAFIGSKAQLSMGAGI